MTGWTDEQVVLAVSLWRQGVPATQIGDRVDKTRNAVIGKMHRLNIPHNDGGGDSGPVSEMTPPPAREPIEPDPVEAVSVAPEPAIPEPDPVPEPEVEAPAPPPIARPKRQSPIVPPEGVPFLTAVRCCKFPLWPHQGKVSIHEKRVCGVPVHGKEKWCEKHRAIVFEPIRERRSRGVI